MLTLIINENNKLENRWIVGDAPNDIQIIQPALKDSNGKCEPVEALSYTNGVVSVDSTIKDQVFLAELKLREVDAYINNRIREYPSVGDQLDALYKKHNNNDPTEYDAICEQITAVKIKYPKV